MLAPLTYTLSTHAHDIVSGLSFDAATQTISGTPTTVTPETDYTYTVTDYDGDTDEPMFSITVTRTEPDTSPTFGSEMITDKVYLTGTAVTGGNPPVTYRITPPLPAGLRFNSNTRIISGTPTRASSTTYMGAVTDRNEDTAEVSFMLSVTDPPDQRPPRPVPNTRSGGGGGCAVSD